MKQNRPAQSPDPLAAKARELRAETERFERRWTPAGEAEPCLTFSWEDLERQLVDLAPTDLQAELVHKLVARTKVYAQLKPQEMVLREILGIAALVLEDVDLAPGSDPV